MIGNLDFSVWLCSFSSVKLVPENRACSFSYKQSSQGGYIPKSRIFFWTKKIGLFLLILGFVKTLVFFKYVFVLISLK